MPGKPRYDGKFVFSCRVNVTMQDIKLPKMMQDTTVVIKPKQFDVTKLLVRTLDSNQ